MNSNKLTKQTKTGFTIVELLLVIVVIAILAAIVVFGYRGIQERSAEALVQSDLNSFAKQLQVDFSFLHHYPDSLSSADDGRGLKTSGGNTAIYTTSNNNTNYCLTIYNQRPSVPSYYISSTQDSSQQGVCPGHSVPGDGGGGGSLAIEMQSVNSANCPTERTLAVDARDNHTYWIQKLADGKCWMLTNLAYGGGGNNTYNDTKTLINGTSDTAYASTQAKYYVGPDANPTTNPQAPSVATDGGVNPSTRQFGYLYNWCAAMGNQQGTSACLEATAPAANVKISICPAGWRLPTGAMGAIEGGGELSALNDAVNGGLIHTGPGHGAGLIGDPWLGQLGGNWNSGGFSAGGSSGYYWSSTQGNFSASFAGHLGFSMNHVSPHYGVGKVGGLSVRCITN